MANFKRTYINADEELVIQGKLTIEGELEQKEFVETSSFSQTNFSGDVLVVNADGFTKDVSPTATNSELKLRSGDANASLLFNSVAGTLTLSASPAITTTLTVDGDISATDITASGTFTGALSGNATSATTATALATARNFSITGDVLASAVSFSGIADVALSSALATVNSNVGTFGTVTAIPQVTVNAKGLTTGVTNVAIAIPHTQITDFDAEVRALVSVTDAGGDGSLAYSAGVITYTGPSAAEVRAHLSAGTGITYSGGVISTDATIHPNHSSVTLTAGAGLTGGGTIAANRTFDVVGGTGIDANANDIAIDSTVVTLTGTQTLTNKTLTNPIISQISGDVTITGDLTVVNIDSATQTDSVIADASITLRHGAGSNGDAHIYVVATGDNPYVKWDTGTSRWQFSNNGSTDKDLLLLSDFSVTDSGGDGSLAYNNSTGVITYTGPSAAETQAHLTGGAGLTYSSGTFAVGAGDGIDVNADDIDVDATVVRTSGNQSIAGIKTFSNTILLPDTATATTGAIYTDDSAGKAYVYVDGGVQEITPASSVGTVEDVGATGTDIYAGSRTSGATTYHGIKSLAGGTGVTVADSGNVVTVTTDAFRSDANVRALFSAVDSSGDGTLTYNSGTGAFTYSGISDAQVRGKISGTGLISYNSSTGVISTTADNYSSFTVQTDTGSGGAEAISSGETLTFVGGTNTTVTNSGNTITIRNDNDADIEAVTAGDGLSGGGSSGSVTLALDLNELTAAVVDVANDSIAIVDANASNASRKETIADLVTAMAGTNLTATNGVLSSTADLTGVTAGTGLTGGGTSGAVTLNVSGLTTAEIAAGSLQLGSEAFADNDTSLMTSAAVQDKILSYGYTTETGDITGVTAGTALSGGGTSGTITLNVSGLTTAEIAAGSLQLGSESFADNDTSLMTSAAIQDKILSYGYTTETGDITGVTAGTALSGGGSSGAVTLNVSGLTTAEIAAGSIQLGSESFSDSDSVLMTAAAVQDKILSYGYTTETGDITAVVAGTGLTGGATSGSATLNVNTGAVSNGASTIPTGDQVYDFVIGLGYSTTTGDITGVTAGSYLTGGGSSGSVTLNVDATSANTASKVVARDGSGNFSAGTITATATSAQYADLAENYSADADYEVGTVVVIGGEQEITTTSEVNSTKVAGVISSNPAYLMNADCGGEFPKSVALRGRIPVKVIGVVQKGDVLVTSDTPGFAMSAVNPHDVSASEIVGKSLEIKYSAEGGIIEALI